jgi:predicted metalloprotease with PDZ domain
MKRDPKKPPRFDGTIRMVVENQDGKVAVSIVRSGSPAERAGIKLGDTVLSIEGRDVRGLGPGAINYSASAWHWVPGDGTCPGWSSGRA